MEKTIYSEEYLHFLQYLIQVRKNAGITQIELAERLGKGATQSFVSKCERGERRIDIAELRAFCLALGTSFPDFVRDAENALEVATNTSSHKPS
jgi:transcriptional regulator with XRE-family HTH domain